MALIRVGSATFGSRFCLLVLAVVVIALVLAPEWASRDWVRLLGEFCAYAALASLWNHLAGYAGLDSVGQQAFVGLGGYLLYAMAIFLGVNPVLTIPVAGLAAAIIAVPTAVTGYFGQNVPYPGFGREWGWLFSCGMILGIGSLLYISFKKRGWL